MSSTGDVDAAARLEMSRRVIEALEADCERLESLLVRLPSLLSELDPDRLTAGVAEAGRELTGGRFAMFVASAGDERSAVWAGLKRADFVEVPAIRQAPLLAGVLWHDQPVRVDDAAAWVSGEDAARPYGVLVDGRLVRSWLAAPVHGRGGRSLGALYVGHHRAGAFSIRQEELLAGLCTQLGTAIEHAELFAERTRVAATLQESLLPPLLPAIPGVDAAARYRATGAGNLVGGDFYDVFPLDGGSWGLMLGDVSGFGPEAAALTGLARYTVRAIARHAPSPSWVLSQLNDAMSGQQAGDRFCTAVYARFTPADDGRVAVILASGGHPPVLILRDDETVEVLDRSTGTLLGMFADVVLRDESFHLERGDALVLYTDGVIEGHRPGGEQFGSERLTHLLSTCGGRSADGIARRIELAVLDHQAGVAVDDVAVLVLRAEP